jgi:subtilisin
MSDETDGINPPPAPRLTGRSLVMARGPEAPEPEEMLRQMVPKGESFQREYVLLPGGGWVAWVDRTPDHLIPPEAAGDLHGSQVLFEAERFQYLPRRIKVEASRDVAPPPLSRALQMIRADETTLTGRGAVIAVLDGGLDRQHPDFVGRIPDGDVASFVGGTGDDLIGHGTHCAGIIAGPRVPCMGPRYGVAPDARLLVAQVSDPSGQDQQAFDYAVIQGLVWAAMKGAHVASLSLGTPADRKCQKHSQIFDWIARILRRERGMIIIAACGNGSRRPKNLQPIFHPADCPSIVAAAGLKDDFLVAPFSCGSICNQRNPSLAAPGLRVRSSIPTSTDPINPFGMADGTSAATPHVAGVAALWVEKTRGLRGKKLMNLLLGGVGKLADGPDAVGAGCVQAPK